MIRIAAIADVHVGKDSAGTLAPFWRELHEHADVLLLGGDLTRFGTAEEAQVLADELSVVNVPAIVVLGNHDYHSGREDRVVSVLEDAGAVVLEGRSHVLEVGGVRVGIAGMKGFGGGFLGACATDFGEPEMKAFIRHTRHLAEDLERELDVLEGECDFRITLLHYAPIDGTIEGEKRQIYPFLGSYLLGEAIDRAGSDLVFHGHAHMGRERGVTPGGIPVRNVAQTVLRHAYNVYRVDETLPAANT